MVGRRTQVERAVLLCLGLLGCDHLARHATRHIERGVLAFQTRIVQNDSFSPSTVVVGRHCDIAFVGSSWGALAVLHADGLFDTTARWVPGNPHFAVAVGSGSNVVLWAHAPDWWGIMRTSDWSVTSMPVPVATWGGHWTGPATLLDDSSLALAPMSDQAAARERPKRWSSPPLVEIVDLRGQVRTTVDSLADSAGNFLPWAHAWLAVGSIHDSLATVGLLKPDLSVYARGAHGAYHVIRRVELPRYLPAYKPAEEVVTLPWIQFGGGDLFSLSAVPAITAATFAPSGILYAVRPHSVVHKTVSSALFTDAGQWLVDDDDLEAYDSRGRLIGAYELPTGGVDWVRVDEHGRLIVHATHEVLIARDPFASVSTVSPACPPLPARLDIPTKDRPSPMGP